MPNAVLVATSETGVETRIDLDTPCALPLQRKTSDVTDEVRRQIDEVWQFYAGPSASATAIDHAYEQYGKQLEENVTKDIKQFQSLDNSQLPDDEAFSSSALALPVSPRTKVFFGRHPADKACASIQRKQKIRAKRSVRRPVSSRNRQYRKACKVAKLRAIRADRRIRKNQGMNIA